MNNTKLYLKLSKKNYIISEYKRLKGVDELMMSTLETTKMFL